MRRWPFRPGCGQGGHGQREVRPGADGPRNLSHDPATEAEQLTRRLVTCRGQSRQARTRVSTASRWPSAVATGRRTRSARTAVSPGRERVMDSGVYRTAGSGGPPVPSVRHDAERRGQSTLPWSKQPVIRPPDRAGRGRGVRRDPAREWAGRAAGLLLLFCTPGGAAGTSTAALGPGLLRPAARSFSPDRAVWPALGRGRYHSRLA